MFLCGLPHHLPCSKSGEFMKNKGTGNNTGKCYTNLSADKLFIFSPWRFVDLVKVWQHTGNEFICYTGTTESAVCAHAIQPLLWLTLGLLNVHILPELPMCRRPNSVRGKTVAYGIQLFCRLLYEPPS